jgi:hypothetical protein
MVTRERLIETIKAAIIDYARFEPSYGPMKIETVFDDVSGHYELIYSGWQSDMRVHGSVIHIDVVDNKVLIEYDGTEYGIARELNDRGIPKEQIVLAFMSEERRRHSQYAVN